MKALVLAAGLGTRLRPLTERHAKPSLPVVGIPALWYGVWHLAHELGVKDFAMNFSHAPDSIRAAAEDADLKRFTGASFHYSDETAQILGSSGALWKLRDWIGSEVLAVCNGDSISFPSWQRMKAFHHKSGSKLTMHVRKFSGGLEPYTDIELSDDGRVKAFGAKTSNGIMFAGSYLFEPELLSCLPAGASELRPTILEPLIREGKLFAFREDIDWFDTGTVEAYADVQFELLKKLPRARELIEVKMREANPDVWLPKTWGKNAKQFSFKSPVIMTGDAATWANSANSFGPNFIGIIPPPTASLSATCNALVFSNHIVRR